MHNFTRKISMLLVAFMLLTYMPVNAISNRDYSKFGISHVSLIRNQEGKREVSVNVSNEVVSTIKEMKIYLKVVQRGYDPLDKGTVFEGPSIILNNGLGNNFTGTLEEKDIKNFGEYHVDKIEIYLTDGTKKVSYNEKFYDSLSDNDKENGEIITYYSIGEINNPITINEININKTLIKLGDEQKVELKIESSNEEVYPNLVYVNFINDTSKKEQTVIAKKLEENNYQATITLTNSLDTGVWRINKVDIIDNFERSLSNNVYPESFTVVSENADINAPVLKGITLNKNVYDGKKSDKPYFDLDITDDLSGFRSGTITLVNKADKNITYDINIWFNGSSPNESKYRAGLNGIKKNGDYTIKRIYIEDNSKNSVVYYNSNYYDSYVNSSYIKWDFKDVNITAINNEEEEKVNVEILDIKNNSKEVKNNTEIDYEIKVKSNVKIKYMTISVENQNNNSVSFSTRGVEENNGIYTFKVKGVSKSDELEYMASGNYIADHISFAYDGGEFNKQHRVYDLRSKHSNKNIEKYDLKELDFKCNNPNEDITPPEILEINLDKNVVVPGEKVNISIKAKDDKSGFVKGWNRQDPSISYKNGAHEIDARITEFDEVSGVFKGTIEIPTYASTGAYYINYLSLYDIARNNKYYGWYNESDKNLLSQGSILVKKDLNEMLPPVITTNIKEDIVEGFKAPFTPIVNSDHGTVEMLLNGNKYNGEPINKIGNYHLLIKATGVDGSVSTKKVSFKVISEINNETKPEEVADQIKNSEEKNIEVEVKNDEKVIDASIFEAIKGTDKAVSFTQNDGTVWTFNGNDIKDENIGNIKISVSNIADEENIEKIDRSSRVIHFDYHGTLPGKASVKIKVNNPGDMIGKDLTFYYYNPETKKPEKVQGPLSIDKDGYVTVEIEHCSDYFLSTKDNLDTITNMPTITVKDTDLTLKEGENYKLNVTVDPIDVKPVFTSLNENIAKVNENGEIVALSQGETQIKIEAKEAVVFVNVKVEKKEDYNWPIITVDRDEFILAVDEEVKINATVTPENTKLNYVVMDKNIITVSNDGVIKGLAKGETVVVIDTGATLKTIKVIVNEKKVTIPEENQKPDENGNKENNEIEKPIEKPNDDTVDINKPSTNPGQVEEKKPVTKPEVKPVAKEEVKQEVNEAENILPKTGDKVSTNTWIIISLITVASGVLLYRRK